MCPACCSGFHSHIISQLARGVRVPRSRLLPSEPRRVLVWWLHGSPEGRQAWGRASITVNRSGALDVLHGGGL